MLWNAEQRIRSIQSQKWGFSFFENQFVKCRKSNRTSRNNFSASWKRQLFLLDWSPLLRAVYRNNRTFWFLESVNYCGRKAGLFKSLGYLMYFFLSGWGWKSSLNNERQAKYLEKQPSEARRQENPETHHIRRFTLSPNLVCDKEFYIS